LLWAGLADSTRKSYATGYRSYIQFIGANSGLPLLPATDDCICLWLASLHGDGLAFSTIRIYLSALRSAHVDAGVLWSANRSPIVERMYRGIKRVQGIAATVRPRFPVTFAVLDKLEPQFNLSDPTHRLIRAAIWTATAGLFRIGELVPDSASLPLSIRVLRIADYTRSAIDPPTATIHLRASKTDVFRAEIDVHIGNRRAIAAMQQYLQARTDCKRNASGVAATGNEPLFAHGDGKPLTRRQLLQAIALLIKNAGIDTSKHSGFSFRRGGATSLGEAGVSDRLIKTIGRWRSWAYARYVETPLRQITDASAHL
jgi:hypothetical protein